MDWSGVEALTSAWILPVLMGIGLSACAGIRACIPLMLVSALAYFGQIELNASMYLLGDFRVLVALVIASGLEVAGDKIPALDNALDTIGTFARPTAGIIASSSLLAQTDAAMALMIGLILGGGTALSVAVGKGALRLASTATAPIHGGLGNVALSFCEDAFAILVSILSFLVPILSALLAIALVATCIYCLVRWKRKTMRNA